MPGWSTPILQCHRTMLVCLIPVTHTFFREPRAAARACPLVLPRVVGAAQVVVLRLEVELLTVPTSDWSLLIEEDRNVR